MSPSITPKKRFEVRRISLMNLENLGLCPVGYFPHVEVSPVGSPYTAWPSWVGHAE